MSKRKMGLSRFRGTMKTRSSFKVGKTYKIWFYIMTMRKFGVALERARN